MANELDPLEISMINYVKKLSLSDTRKDLSYTYKTIRIEISTLPNNGLVIYGSRRYRNKCFFISLAQGVNKLGYKITAGQLINMCRFRELDALVDTDNDDHKQKIELLSKSFPEVFIAVHIGSYDRNVQAWFTTPDPDVTFGDPRSKEIVRIVNKGNHFELITTSEDRFVYEPRTMSSSRLQSIQQELFENY